MDTPCVQIDLPVNGTSDNVLEKLQNIENHAKQQLQDNKTRECYGIVDTQKHALRYVVRQSTIIASIRLTSLFVFFKDPSDKKVIAVYQRQTFDLRAYYFNHLKEQLPQKPEIVSEINNASFSAKNCTKVEVPVGQTNDYFLKMNFLEAFGDRQILDDQAARECILDLDTNDWQLISSQLFMSPSKIGIAFMFYSSDEGTTTAVIVICVENKQKTSAMCEVDEKPLMSKFMKSGLFEKLRIKVSNY